MNKAEMQELLRDEGAAAGLGVMGELPVIYWDNYCHGRIDFAWFIEGSRVPYAVFEIEGANVPSESLQGDLRKFYWVGDSSGASIKKYILLYSHRAERTLVSTPQKAVAAVQSKLRIEIANNQQFANTTCEVLIDDSSFIEKIRAIAKSALECGL
ncbi:hypothetical protein [Derxia lacustris]|uniref:hypothetical protein n=1 Tax=Derxia lacustris TaxID=764842 RepID=UPI00111C0E4C|nr:hypothetical protein [Derxia lacustris]